MSGGVSISSQEWRRFGVERERPAIGGWVLRLRCWWWVVSVWWEDR